MEKTSVFKKNTTEYGHFVKPGSAIRSNRCFGFLLIFMLCCQWATAGDNWPLFRGPTGDGLSEASGLPVTWSETENIVWKTPIHDLGWSTPVIWEKQIWLTTATEDGHKLYAVCIDLKSGAVIFDILVFEIENPQGKHGLNSFATPSPAVESGRVYVHFGTHGTACLDTRTAQILWTRQDLNCNHLQGPAGSPILYKNMLILHVDGTDVQYIIALDKKTGQTIWKTDRPAAEYEKAIPLYRKAYTTPIVIRVAGRDQIVSVGAQMCHAYDPKTGEEIWSVRYGTDSTISSPVSDGNLVFVSTGYQQPSPELWAIKANGLGDVTETHVQWKVTENVPIESSVLVKNGLVYMVSDRGHLTCLEAGSGQIVWQESMRVNYGASPVWAEGLLYFCDKKGQTIILEGGREFKIVGRNRLDEGFMASPVVQGESIILRTKSFLYRISD